MQTSGSLIIISAPSGTGKTSLVFALTQKLSGVRISVSHTTRAPRPGENNGVHYNFVNKAEFTNMLDSGAFLEHAKVFDNYYGTSSAWVFDTLQQGLDVILEIDWQGAQQVRSQYKDAISIFVLPPDEGVLLSRLTNRKSDKEAVIAQRMVQAKSEASHFYEYDYLIVNDQFDQALTDLMTIVSAARLRCVKQQALRRDLIDRLCQKS